jgi:hypothetical protein
MTKQESIKLFQDLNRLGNLKGVKFSYAIAKNIAMLKAEIESLEKAVAPSEEFMKEDEKRVALAKEHAKKDEKGEPVTVTEGGVSKFEMEDDKAFDESFKKLKEENKEIWDAREKQITEYNELLKTESTVELYKVAKCDIPNDINVMQMNSIMDLVEDSVPSPYPTK